MVEEQYLMDQCREGDEEAFSLLVEKLIPVAYRTSYVILNSREYAEDAVQIALTDTYLSLMKGTKIDNFKGYFFRLVYNRTIDLYRKNKRVTHIHLDKSAEGIAKTTVESAQSEAIIKENRSELLQYIMSLSHEQSMAILMYYYEELSISDISMILEENENTIKSRLRRGKNKLADLLKEKNESRMEVKANGI